VAIVDGHGSDAAHPPGHELRRLTDAIRRVTNQIVLTAASPAQLRDAAVAVEAVADALAPATPAWQPSVSALLETSDPHHMFPFSPQIGIYNPLAPPVMVEIVDGGVRGTGHLDAAYEGPPGCVHGGVIASLFDELLGLANIAAGVGAMTGTLTIKYRSPTPLKTDLTFTARHLGVDGRKVRAEGAIHAGERLCAESQGVFILVDHTKFLGHTREYGGPHV
jgi:acyl-coenzyme A thioesterase PaaI-like protein